MTRLALLIAVAPLALAAPAAAQTMDPMMPGMSMPGMKMPAKPKPKPKPKPKAAKPRAKAPAKPTATTKPAAKAATPAARAAPKSAPDPHAGHDMGSMPGMEMPGDSAPNGHDMSTMPDMEMESQSSEHNRATPGMDMSGMRAPGPASGTNLPAGDAPPPPPPTDHAAERVYPPMAMAAARDQFQAEHGGGTYYQVLLNLAEYQFRNGRDGFRWDGEGWIGGDIDRLVIKSEGEGAFGKGVEAAEVQALYSHAIGPYFNLQGGVRYDFKPNPSRTYATVGVEGLAPGMFDVEGALFLSNKGDVLGRLEGWYDQRITQRLVLQPRVEANFAAQDVRENDIGSGLSNLELGLRLRYEIRREFAPYVGISYDRRIGDTARFARAAGEDPSVTSFVAGIRFWF